MIEKFKNALLQIDRLEAASIFKQCYQDENDFHSLEDLVIKSLEQIGEGWENASYSLAQVYMSGVICEELIEEYLPKSGTQRKDTPRIAIGVLEDHHVLGKRIVSSILKAGGYTLFDFGKGLSPDQIAAKAVENRIEVLLISTLMLSAALKVKDVKKQLKGEDPNIKIIVGGSPFRLDNQLWQTVGADAKGDNASDVIDLIKKVCMA